MNTNWKSSTKSFNTISESIERIIWVFILIVCLTVCVYIVFDERDVGLFIEFAATAGFVAAVVLISIRTFGDAPLTAILRYKKVYDSETAPKGIAGVVSNLHTRSNQSRGLASLTLLLLVAALAAGFWVFVFAGNIHDPDTEDRILMRSRLKDSYDQIRELNEKIKITDNADDIVKDAVLTDLVKDMDTLIKNAKSIEESIELGLQSNKEAFYQSLITRFGALVILFLVVQILGRLYRANLSLSATYGTLANSITMWSERQNEGSREEDLDLEKLIVIMAPKGTEIPDTKLPIEQISDGLSTLGGRKKKGVDHATKLTETEE